MKDQDKGAEHFSELPEKTQQFLKDLRDEDVALLKDGIRMVLALRTVGTFGKWVILTLVGAFIASVALAENIMKVLTWLKGGK